jgi:hypothetical protein
MPKARTPELASRFSHGAAGRLDEVALNSPTGAIVEAFGQVEIALKDVLEARRIEGSDGRWSVMRLASLAQDKDLITAETYDAIEGLSVLVTSRPTVVGKTFLRSGTRVCCPYSRRRLCDHDERKAER